MSRRQDASRDLREARLASLAVMGLGVVAVIGATSVRSGAGYVAVGPQVMPAVVGVGLIALGACLLVRSTIRPDGALASHLALQRIASRWPAPILTLAVLAAYAFALGSLGYVIATTLMVPVTARVLGSGRPVRDVAIGSVLALVVYVAFNELLGVRLPAGLLEPVLG